MGWLIFIFWIILIGIFSDHFWLVTILYAIIIGIGYVIYTEIKRILTWKHDAEEYHKRYNEILQLENKKRDLEISIKKLAEEQIKFRQEKVNTVEEIKQLAQEKSSGFPWLAKAFTDYFYYKNLKEANYLEHKSHPAPVSAERVREIARGRRITEEKLRIAQGVINYYQELFPFLEEFLGDVDEEILKKVLSRNIEEPIKVVDEIGIDPVRIYLSSLSEEEYRKLSTIERNQLALDRFWTKPKNKWQLGRDYERYIGYIYEADGYNVYYQGILEGYDDLGRDLICKKEGKTIIVQCKRWAQYKTIHEKHINQLYGTVIKYIIDHPDEKVGAILYTTTKLSDRAKDFAKHLNIGIVENFPFQKYPSIKCNISRMTGEKIYHLPFDQQYDKTLIEEERNELYVETVEEAEKLGYRRAWRWRGEKGNTEKM